MTHEDNYRGYVLGFLFDPAIENVLLIKKTHPAAQAGRFNGVGGKIEKGESHLSAMIRECTEETGITYHDWCYVLTFDAGGLPCHVFYGIGDISKFMIDLTDEKPWPVAIQAIPQLDACEMLVNGLPAYLEACIKCTIISTPDTINFTYSPMNGDQIGDQT